MWISGSFLTNSNLEWIEQICFNIKKFVHITYSDYLEKYHQIKQKSTLRELRFDLWCKFIFGHNLKKGISFKLLGG